MDKLVCMPRWMFRVNTPQVASRALLHQISAYFQPPTEAEGFHIECHEAA